MSENAQTDKNLSSSQLRAIEALADGATLEQAAVIADRTPSTLRRWRREDDAYSGALQAAASETLEDAAVQLKGLLRLALERLRDVLEADDVKTHHLLRAIDMTASHAVKLTEFAELTERVERLEEQTR
jgi:transposase-like protein